MKRKTENPPFTDKLHSAPVKDTLLCRIVGLAVLLLGVLMLFRYPMASVSNEPLGLYNNQYLTMFEKGIRTIFVFFCSSALSFLIPGVFSTITGLMVLMGRRSKALFYFSIAFTLACGSIGRLSDYIFVVVLGFRLLSPGQMTYTTWLLIGGLVVLVSGTVLIGREHAKTTAPE